MKNTGTLSVLLFSLFLWSCGGDSSPTGLMYANGEGVPEDDVEAVRLYRLAADQGVTSSAAVE
jgi:TPR repeat protein